MITYIYFVKCPNYEDEPFDFFDEAKGFAMGCLSQKPIITQTEINRNDFGECTDHCDLGTVWSWEEAVGDEITAEPEMTFSKDDLKQCDCGSKCGDDCKCGKHAPATEFDDDDSDFRFINEELLESRRVSFKNEADRKEFFKLCSEIGLFTAADLDAFMREQEAYDDDVLDKLRAYRDGLGDDFKLADGEKPERKPIPEGMTIEELVEEMEKNEDDVECTWCNDLFDKSECRYEVDLGWLCSRCEMAIKSRGETLTFREGNYWDFLDEDVEDTRTLADLVKDSIHHLVSDLGKDPWADDFADDIIADIEKNYDTYVPENAERYGHWCSAVASEVSRQVNNQAQPMDEELKWNTYEITYTTKANPDKEHTTLFKTWQFDVEYAWRMSHENVPHSTIKRIKLIEDCNESAEIHDLGTTYDGGYPADELEDADTYSARLDLCPECGDEHSYDHETGICINCGFNI